MKKLIVISSLLFLSACSSTPTSQSVPLNQADSLPDWVLTEPKSEGLTSAQCVLWSGNMSASKSHAINLARSEIAKKILVLVKDMEKSFNSTKQNNDEIQTSSNFEQISKQVTEQSLAGAQSKEVAFAKIDNKKHLCVLVVMENTNPIIDKIIEKANLDPESDEFLYQEFKNKKLTQEMENDLNNRSKL